MDKGELVPDDVTINMVMDRLSRAGRGERRSAGRVPPDAGAGSRAGSSVGG